MAWYDRFRTRKSNKLKISKVRRYNGAQGGRLFSDFLQTSTSADAEIKGQLKTLRDRSRDLARNDSYVQRYLNLMVSNVVGHSGIRLSMKARNDDGSLDMLANRVIEEKWKDWCKLGHCTVNERQSFIDCQKLFVESLCRDGEVLIRHNSAQKYKYGYRIQFLEADHLDEDKNRQAGGSANQIKMGVEVDQFDKPVAYHLFQKHPYDQEYTTGKQRHIRVAADKLIHAYMPTRPEQNRGVPFTSSAMSNIKMLNGYMEAEIVAARTAASKMGFFVSPDGDQYVGDGEDEEYVPLMNAEAGTFEQLPSGTDFKTFDPDHPSTAFQSFTTQVLRSIASGLNISYHALTNDLSSVNYSSLRAGALEDREMYRLYQKFTIEHFVRPVFEKWLEMAILTGEISTNPNGQPLPISRFEKFQNAANFIPRSFSWVDPQKEMMASISGMQSGLVTFQDVQSNYGRDVEELFEQHDRESRLADQYGIRTAFQPYGVKMPVEPDIQGTEDGETE
ncbi:MAG: putative portal protein [Prokaryotic dsDNA virus sp.]|jgi:lambda family phage portal protein|nr:MAG: putative portal protein [Prokaryotic dsDNA virus sp.]|tara:strand:+ start:8168 stop:9679 length:1512 start_codon:yes stop_codon:yes gene_type:complete